MKRIDDFLNTEEKIKETVQQDFFKMFLCSKFTVIKTNICLKIFYIFVILIIEIFVF